MYCRSLRSTGRETRIVSPAVLDPTPDPPTPDPIGLLSRLPPPAILRVGRDSVRIDDVCRVSVEGASAAQRVGADTIARTTLARLDRDLRGWRRAAPAVLAAPTSTTESATAPTVAVLGWLSETFESRLASGAWEHRLLDGGRLSAVQVDDAARAGGIVVAVTGAGGIESGDAEVDPIAAPPVFAGARHDWMCAKRTAATALIQIGLASAAALDDGSPATASPTVASMIDDLRQWWHGLLSTHVDVPGLIARGLSMARFARPVDYDLRARDVVAGLTDHLQGLGVRSAPVVLP